MNDYRIVKGILKWDCNVELREICKIWIRWGIKMFGDWILDRGLMFRKVIDFVIKYQKYCFKMDANFVFDEFVKIPCVDMNIFDLKKLNFNEIETFDIMNLSLIKKLKKIFDFDVVRYVIDNFDVKVIEYLYWNYECHVEEKIYDNGEVVDCWINDVFYPHGTNKSSVKALFFVVNVIGFECFFPWCVQDLYFMNGGDCVKEFFEKPLLHKKILMGIVKHECVMIDIYFPILVHHCYHLKKPAYLSIMDEKFDREKSCMKDLIWKFNEIGFCLGKCKNCEVIDWFCEMFGLGEWE